MRLSAGLVSLTDLRTALDQELDEPPRLLPPSVVHSALQTHRHAAAEWLYAQTLSEFVPTREETVAISKASHGVRPVAIWDLASQVIYRALSSRLATALPPLSRDRTHWRKFQRAPLRSRKAKYVVASDIASCYQNIDHGPTRRRAPSPNW